MDLLITLFLCGDVMLGRGIDQVFPDSVDPALHEPYVDSAVTYVKLAEQVSGPINSPVDHSYVWGDAIDVLKRANADLRIINLETSVTTSDEFWKGKAIHYRMHPSNVACLTAAQIDCCVLSNNHVLDWGCPGLTETVQTLTDNGIKTAGAGSRALSLFLYRIATVLIEVHRISRTNRVQHPLHIVPQRLDQAMLA